MGIIGKKVGTHGVMEVRKGGDNFWDDLKRGKPSRGKSKERTSKLNIGKKN